MWPYSGIEYGQVIEEIPLENTGETSSESAWSQYGNGRPGQCNISLNVSNWFKIDEVTREQTRAGHNTLKYNENSIKLA